MFTLLEDESHHYSIDRKKTSSGKGKSRFDQKKKTIKFSNAKRDRINREKKYGNDLLFKERRKASKKNRFEPTLKNKVFQESEKDKIEYEIVEQEIWDELEKKIDARADEIYHEMLCNGKEFCPCLCNSPRELAEKEILKTY